jgi:hypothetical protein
MRVAATRHTSQMSFTPNTGVILAATGIRTPSIAGGFPNPTTPKTFCHHAGDWDASCSDGT